VVPEHQTRLDLAGEAHRIGGIAYDEARRLEQTLRLAGEPTEISARCRRDRRRHENFGG
jgi:hypothetical protein